MSGLIVSVTTVTPVSGRDGAPVQLRPGTPTWLRSSELTIQPSFFVFTAVIGTSLLQSPRVN